MRLTDANPSGYSGRMATASTATRAGAGRRVAANTPEPALALAALVEFQADFAGRVPELIVVQDRDLANLPEPAQRRVRRLQRTYVEIWVDTLQRVQPGLTD